MRKAIIIGIIAVIVTVAIYWNTGAVYHNFYDDSYITMRYAVNLAEHGELAYNLGERVDAASSFLFTVILAGAYKVGFHNLEMVSGVINLLSLFFVAFFVYLSVAKLTGEGWLTGFMALVASLHGLVSGWATQGMGTTFFTAMLCAFVYYTLVERNDRVSLILMCLLVLTRMEGLIAVPMWAYVNRKDAVNIWTLVTVMMVFYQFKTFYYGSPLPNSLTMKLSREFSVVFPRGW